MPDIVDMIPIWRAYLLHLGCDYPPTSLRYSSLGIAVLGCFLVTLMMTEATGLKHDTFWRALFGGMGDRHVSRKQQKYGGHLDLLRKLYVYWNTKILRSIGVTTCNSYQFILSKNTLFALMLANIIYTLIDASLLFFTQTQCWLGLISSSVKCVTDQQSSGQDGGTSKMLRAGGLAKGGIR